MKAKKVGKITWGQDGAIWGGYLFRFGSRGECFVYELAEVKKNGAEQETKPICTFKLDKAELIAPHSNVVSFGNEYFSPDDEFPLLYSNIYNNYASAQDPLKGVTCVYRLQRNGAAFFTTLVQVIGVGFAEDAELWRSADGDIRPYGNFAIDKEKGVYYAFTMRDQAQTTRYFAFELPKLADGDFDEKLGVRKVVLNTQDIKEYFDCEYHRFIQGACFHGGKIYSVEGFSGDEKNKPALRVIDVRNKRQEHYVDFVEMDMPVEPEFIEFYQERCYYCDGHGNVYELTF